MNFLNIITNHVYCMGDIHGEFESVIGWIKRYDLTDSTIIFCGDCGFGFNKPEYYNLIVKKINLECKKRNVYCLMIRGNHDDPLYFNDKKKFKKNYVRTIEDYTVINFTNTNNEHLFNVLCVGGGISVDRSDRIHRMNHYIHDYIRYHNGNITLEDTYNKISKVYWEDEYPVYNEELLKEIIDNNINIDYICSHSCPSFCEPTNKDGINSWLKVDETLKNDLDKEREVFDNIYKYIKDNNPGKLKGWYYGHYHFHNLSIINDIKFYLLDMGHYGNFDMVEIL